MITHIIIVASAYSIGKRIVLHYTEDSLIEKKLDNELDYIRNICGTDVPFSVHLLQTDSISFESVIKTDKYFENTMLINTKEEYAEILLRDRELNGIDVAKYILSIVPCTHLKLQKLVYMCYADYLCNEDKKLFRDKIFSYKYGPVINSVYEKYKNGGNKEIEEDNKIVYDEGLIKLPVRSRILSSENGIKKLFSINNTLSKYGNYTASELVNLTHKELTPWEKSGSGNYLYGEITDELIKKYHENEA